MKAAGIARAQLAVTALTLVGMLFLGSVGATPGTAAAAGIVPYTMQVPANTDFDVDGTDVYWITRGLRRDRSKHRFVFEVKLMRGSLLNKSVAQLGVYDEDNEDFPVSVLANAGIIYVNFSTPEIEGEGPLDAASKVVRMSRDGTNAVTIAQSSLNIERQPSIVFEKGVGRLNDCGSTSTATSVSFTGDVVISQLTSDRESKQCGRKKNVDHWTYFELTASGVKREITSETLRVERKIGPRKKDGYDARWGTVTPPISDPWVYYGKAVFQKVRDSDFYVRDLATGTEQGPFTIKSPGHDFYAWAAVSSAGQLAAGAQSWTGDSKHEKFHQKAGVFRVPGDPTSFAKHKGSSGMQFCGDHLIVNNSRGLTEVDSNTFFLQRVVAGKEAARGLSLIEPACTDRFYYVTRYTAGGKTALSAYPLG